METAQCNDNNDRTRFCQICTALPLLTKKLCFQKTLKKNKAKIIIIIIRCVCRRQGGTASQCRSTGWRWFFIDLMFGWSIDWLVEVTFDWLVDQRISEKLIELTISLICLWCFCILDLILQKKSNRLFVAGWRGGERRDQEKI